MVEPIKIPEPSITIKTKQIESESDPIQAILTNDDELQQNLDQLNPEATTQSGAMVDTDLSYYNCFPLKARNSELYAWLRSKAYSALQQDPSNHANKNIKHLLENQNKSSQECQEDGDFWDNVTKLFVPEPVDTILQFNRPILSTTQSIPRMNFRQYWEFASFQVSSMQLDSNTIYTDGGTAAEVFLNRLHLSLKNKDQDKQDTIKKIKSILAKPFTQDSITALKELLEFEKSFLQSLTNQNYTIDKAIAYLHQKYTLYQNITIGINVDQEKNTYETVIKEGGTPLVTITYPQNPNNSDQNTKHYNFKIEPNLTEEQLEKALKIAVDQTHRSKQLTDSNGVNIYGFENNPKQALKLFIFAINSGLNKIDVTQKTKDAWKKKEQEYTGDSPNPYTQALELIRILEPLSCVCNNAQEQERKQQTIKQLWNEIKKMPDVTQEEKLDNVQPPTPSIRP